jgi:hypothetical protein
MDIDLDRWQALLTAYRNSVDASPPFMLLQEAHGRASRARADLEDFEARGAVGQRSPRHPDMQASFTRGVDELTKRLEVATAEVKRISALQGQSSARRNALRQLVDGVRTWAKAQSINLPDDDAMQMTGFAASSVHIPTPPAAARSWP